MNYIVQPRVIPKTLSRGIVARNKVLKKISENLQKSVILLCAPAGYGKTTLLLHFLSLNKYKFSWMNVRPDMDNFYTFIRYLIHSLRQLDSEFGTATLALIDDYLERYQLTKNLTKIINDITVTFLNEFCKCFIEDIIIVVDELENIENSEWLNYMFNLMFGNVPQNMHFIITTRQMPGFNLGMLLARRNLIKITTDDLIFQTNEIEELLRTVYNIECSENDIRILKDKSNGWITGLHLILQSYGTDFKKLHLEKIIILQDIFNYFTEDIFNNLNEEVRDFLLKTSLLDGFTINLCNELLGASDAKKIITELLNKNIFIQINLQQSTESEASYNYQSLFKKFLNTKLYEIKSSEEIDSFLRRVYSYYLEKKEYPKAINCSLELKDFEAAVSLIQEHFQEYFDAGNFELIWNWFEALGERIVGQNPYLLHFKSLMLRLYKGSVEESMPYVEKAIEQSKKQDKDFFVKCVISKAGNLLTLGKISDAIINLNEIINIKTDKQNRLLLLYRLAYAHYLNSDYNISLGLLDKAIHGLESSELPKELKDARLHIFNLYGHIFLIRGDFAKSISYYEQVVKNADKLIDLFETYCNLVLLYAQSGKFNNGYANLSKAKEIHESIQIPIYKIIYLLAYQALRFEYGDYEGSIKLLEEVNEIAIKLNHKYYIYLSYSLIADSFYYLNKLSNTEEFLDVAFKYVNESSLVEKTQYAYMKALMLKKAEPSPSVEPVLLETYNFYADNKFVSTLSQIAFHLADYFLKKNNLEATRKYLTEALETSKEKEYISFLQREMVDSKNLFDFAIANNIHKDFIGVIKDSVMNRKNEEWVSPECRHRLMTVRQSFYDVSLLTLGKNEILIRQNAVSENNWSKKKWKLIFVYLLLNSKKGLTKDKIIDIFYPETSLESADNIFYQVISKFRNLIRFGKGETEKPKGKKSSKELKTTPSIIEYEDGVLSLNKDLSYYIDADVFEKYYRLSSQENDRQRKIKYMKKALGLYNGEFLEGNYETWCEELRTTYKSYFMLMSEELINLLSVSEEYDECIKYSENLLKYDKVNLPAYEGLIKSYIRLDKYNLAKEKYSQMIQDYKKEYSEEPPIRIIKKIDMALSSGS